MGAATDTAARQSTVRVGEREPDYLVVEIVAIAEYQERVLGEGGLLVVVVVGKAKSVGGGGVRKDVQEMGVGGGAGVCGVPDAQTTNPGCIGWLLLLFGCCRCSIENG